MGSIGYTIASLLFFVSVTYLPVIGNILMVFSPIFLIHYFRHENRTRNTDIISVFFVLFAIYSYMFMGIAYVLMVLLPVILFLRFFPNDGGNIAKPMLISTLPVLIGYPLIFALYPESMDRIATVFADMMLNLQKSMGEGTDNITTGSFFGYRYNIEDIDSISLLFAKLTPGINAAHTVLLMYVSSKLYVRSFARKLPPTLPAQAKGGESVPQDGYYVMLPLFLVWALLGSSFLFFTSNDVTLSYIIAVNVLLTSCALYLFQGIEVLLLLAKRYNVKNYIKYPILVVLLMNPTHYIILIAVGVLSTWIKFIHPETGSQHDEDK